MTAEDPNAMWLPSSNFDAGRRGNAVELIILHTTEAGYDSALGWLRGEAGGTSNRASSSHYLISADGRRLAQLVREADTAWGAGNLAYNRRAVNIEQEGYTDVGEFSADLYEVAARLVSCIAGRHGIPLDREHVIGHMDVPDPYNPALLGGASHHHDPGPHYDFDRLLAIASGSSAPVDPCRYFAQTGHRVCHGFRAFWESHGDVALMTFGYPLSEEFTNEAGIVVQYFERARFEWHPGSGQNPWDVLLGRVGDEVAQRDRESHPEAFVPGTFPSA
ncbi:MAG: peptidoglycan recognition family protein [Nitrolancea sp.]